MDRSAARAPSHRASAGVPRSAGLAALAGSTGMLVGPWAGDAGSVVGAVALLLIWLSAGLLVPLWRRSRLWAPASIALLAATATAGIAWDQRAQHWPVRLSGERVLAEVELESLPSVQGGVLRSDVAARIVAPRDLQRTVRLDLVWRSPPRPMPGVGERWRLLLRVEALPEVRNPGAADASRAALRRRIHGRATVLVSGSNRRIEAAGCGLDVLRERIERSIRDTVEDRDAAALFAGLAVGATGGMTREQWQVFAATGTTHLVAISGMHVTLFAWLAAGAARRLWALPLGGARRRPPAVRREVFAAVVGVCAAIGYALLAGFGIPTQRTVVMLAVWYAMRTGGREQSGAEALGWAALAVLVIDPLAPLSSGFWLSFTAMAVLIAGGLEHGGAQRGAVGTLWVTQWRVGLALAPLTLAWFGSVSLAGFVVNMVAIPVISFLLVPLVLAGMVSPFAWQAAGWLHSLGWPLMLRAAEWPGAVLTLDPDPWWIASLAMVTVLWLLPVPWRWRLAALGALLPWVATVAGWLPRADRPAPGEARVTVFDTGDGFASLVQTRGHALLIDTAASQVSPTAGARATILPALRTAGIRRLDLLVLSLAHGGRAAGAAQIRAAVDVRALRIGGGWPGAPPPILPCAGPERWVWDDVQVEVRAAMLPEGSCVVRITPRGGPVLWVAERLDAEEGAALLDGGAALRADVVVVPRRGSTAALAPGLTAAIGARWVLVAAREVSPAKRAALARAWGVPAAHVHATAGQGALGLQLRPGLPPRLLRHAGAWRSAPPSQAALGYDSRAF